MLRFPSAQVSACLGLVLLISGGCSQKVASNQIASAQQSLDQARELIDQQDMQSALPMLDQALGAGGLNADQAAAALLLRAQCYVAEGNLERAEADLSQAELGAPDEALLHLTRGLLLSKQGKSAEARKEFAAAKKSDPSLKIPE